MATLETTRRLHLGPAGSVHVEALPPSARWTDGPDMPSVCSPQAVTTSQRHQRRSQARTALWPAPRTQLHGTPTAAPYLRHVDTALQEGAVGGVVRAHVAVLAPVAREGAADAGQAAAGDVGGEAGPATPPPGLRPGASTGAALYRPEPPAARRGSAPHGLTTYTGVAGQTLSRTGPTEVGARALDHQH